MKRIAEILYEEKFIMLYLALLGMLRSAHEISKFRWEWSWLPHWGHLTDLFPIDSYHFFGGLAAIGLVAGLKINFKKIKLKWYEAVPVTILQVYAVYFYVFAWFYHIIFMKPEFWQWEYVIPFYKLFN